MQTSTEVQSLSAARRRRLSVRLARTEQEVRLAQRLRYRVFVEEMGARLPLREPGVDSDAFDPYCDHLIVRDDDAEAVVGTYRLLRPDNARRLGGLYSAQEFDLARLAHLGPRTLELGRACIDADYRTGAVIMLLWSQLARYLIEHDLDLLLGCASVGMADGGANAAAVYGRLADTALAPAEYRACPHHPLPVSQIKAAPVAQVPALLKGYLNLGAWIGGPPAWDPDFNTADLLVLLPLSRVAPRYMRHFLGASATA